MRVFLDTNVLVSAFTTRGLSSDVVRLVLTEHELVTGEVNLQELKRVLRDRIRLPSGMIGEIEQLLREHPVIPKPDEPSPIHVRDPADRWVLASAVAAKADVLVTGDQDLLDVAGAVALRILSPREFWELARKSR